MSSYTQGITHYIPGYVVKSDFLPTRVVDGNTSTTAEIVLLVFILAKII